MAEGDHKDMNAQTMTLEQIRLVGLQVLARELGPVGMLRFLQQFETGRGDYSAERHQLLGQADVQTLVEKIQQQREPRTSG